MQPVQLSLLPDQVPALPATLIAVLPERQVTAAIALLANLIARTVNPDLTTPPARMPARMEVGDE